jgi:serine/threonine protein kinase/WD40 repeat protein
LRKHSTFRKPTADAFLANACGDDRELFDEAESLLRAAQASGFLKSPTASFVADLPPSESAGGKIGPYKLLQQIGEGGFGAVFMAEQTEPIRRRVALKVIKLGMDTKQVVARFEQERQALAVMDHPNIAKVFDAGATESGRPYFVMELVKGQPITEYCDRQGLSIPERLELFSQVCHAVQHAHTKGVIHRDIKPRNVLVSTHDGKPLVKVIDFGIAKATDQRMTEKTLFTEHQAMIGTPEYMSPEQAEGSLDIDTRTDVYSLGVLLYELLTGATPFDGKSLREAGYGEICRIIREVDPPRPSLRVSTKAQAAWASEAPNSAKSSTPQQIASVRRTEPNQLFGILKGDLDWVVMKALEKDRARRYATPTTLAEDVARYLAGEAVTAVPPSRWYRVRKFVRRNRVAVGAFAAVLGVTATASLLITLTARDAAQRAAEAESASRLAVDAQLSAEVLSHAGRIRAAALAIATQNWEEATRLISSSHESSSQFEHHLLMAEIGEAPRLKKGEEPRHLDCARGLLLTAANRLFHVRRVSDGAPISTLQTPAEIPGEPWFRFQISEGGEWLTGIDVYTSSTAVWRVATGELLSCIVNLPLETPAWASPVIPRDPDGLTVSADGRYMLDRRSRGFATLRLVETGSVIRSFGSEKDPLASIQFSMDGRTTITSYVSGGIEATDTVSGAPRFRVKSECRDPLVQPSDGLMPEIRVLECGKLLIRSSANGAVLLELAADAVSLEQDLFLTRDGSATLSGPSDDRRLGRNLVGRNFGVFADSFVALLDPGSEGVAMPMSLVTGYSSEISSWPAILDLSVPREQAISCAWVFLRHVGTFASEIRSTRPADGTTAATEQPLLAVAFDPSAASLLTLHPDALLTFDPMRIDRFPVSGVIANVLLGAASADGERLVAINQDSLQIIDADGLHERLRVDHSGATTRAVALNATGELLAILDASGELSLRSALDNTVLARGSVSAEFASASPRCAIGSDGSIAVANGRGDVVVFARSTDLLTERTRTSVSGGAVTAIVAVPARKEFLVGMKDGSTHVVDEASLAVRVTLPTSGSGGGHAIGAMTPSFDGLRYFTASADGSIRIWHSETGKELLTLNEERITAAPTAIFIEPNNERLVVGYANGAERIWDAVTWAERVRRRGKPEWPNTEPKLVPAGPQADATDNR